VDYTVKVDASGLSAGSTYSYWFSMYGNAQGTTFVNSALGITKTLPVGGIKSNVKFAFLSCQNMANGYFNGLARIAARTDLQFVLHLGDYIYEYADGELGTAANANRIPQPNRTLCSLSDYRTRYAQYHGDSDMQAVHAVQTFINVWDDHEVTNNAWSTGEPLNMSACPGMTYAQRKAGAQQAFFENVPIRSVDLSGGYNQVYRTFSVGNLIDVFMLDTRLEGRTEQILEIPGVADNITAHHIISNDQAQWLMNGLQSSSAQWKIIASQVIFGQVYFNDLVAPFFQSQGIDQWDGYEASRNQILEFLDANAIQNVIIVSGDLHSSFIQDVSRYPGLTQSLAVEFNGPSISSTHGAQLYGDVAEYNFGVFLEGIEPHLRFFDSSHWGYVLMDVSSTQTTAKYYFVDTVSQKSNYEWAETTKYVLSGRNCISDPVYCPDTDNAAMSSSPMALLVLLLALLLGVYMM
jgi:alkaline phosphatase D